MTTINDDYPQGSGTQGRIDVGHSASGNIETANDVDWFRVRLDAGQRYSISTDSSTVSLSLVSDRGTVASSAYGLSQAQKPAVLSYTAQYTGDYYVEVKGGSSIGSYSVGVAASAPNDYSWPLPGIMKPGKSLIGNLGSVNEQDEFVMDVERGKLYKVVVHFADSAATVGNFYGRMIVGKAEVAVQAVKEGDEYVLRYAAGATGKMQVALTANMVAGAYDLRADILDDDFTADASTVGTLAPGGKVSGTFGAKGDADWFKMHLSANEAYAFTLAGATVTPQNTGIGVYDANGNRLASPASGSMWSPDIDGDYFVAVQSLAAQHIALPAIGTYTLSAVIVPGDSGNARPLPELTAQSPVSGTLELAGDADPVVINAAANTYYTVGHTSSAGSLSVGFVGPDGDYVDASFTGSGYVFRSTAAGQYVLKVSGPSAASYTLRLDGATPDDLSNNREQAFELQLGQSLSGKIDNVFDRDMFKIALKAGETYELDLGAAGMSASIGDADGKSVMSGAAGRFTAPHSGDYFISVGGGAISAYQVKVTASPDAAAGSAGTSAVLAIGGTVNGAFDGTGDIDWYAVSLQAGKQYLFEVKYPSSVVQPPLALLDAAGNKLNADIVSVPGSAKYLVYYTAADQGTVYLSLGAPYGMASYSVAASQVAPDDHANQADMGTQLLPGQQLNGTIDAEMDSDAFQVHLLKNHRYTIETLKAGSTKALDSMALFSIDGALEAQTFYSQYAGLARADGQYGLRIDKDVLAGVGDYTVRLVDWGLDDYGDTAFAATRIGPGRHDGVLTTTADADVMIAHLKKGIYELAFDAAVPGGGSVAVHIQNIETSFNSTVAGGKLTFAALTEGDYRFFINGSGTLPSHVAYSLTLSGDGVSSAPGDGNDVMSGEVDGSVLDGFGGRDTVMYGGVRAAYTVTHAGNAVEVGSGGRSDTLLNIERIIFGHAEGLALDVDGVGGQVYRLYQSAFNRAPDLEGLGWWLAAVDRGTSINDVAKEFVVSNEFRLAYGANLSDADFVAQLYRNTLHRELDAEGHNYWLGELAHGQTRANLLIGFSESLESQQLVAPAIANGFAYTPFL